MVEGVPGEWKWGWEYVIPPAKDAVHIIKDTNTNFPTNTNQTTNTPITVLKCMLINTRSIVSKREEMECAVMENKPDLVLITKTWASENVGEGELSLDGYDCMRR